MAIDIEVGDGKYRAKFDDSGRLKVFRHGDFWRDCTGDGFVLALVQEVERLRGESTEVARLRAMLGEATITARSACGQLCPGYKGNEYAIPCDNLCVLAAGHDGRCSCTPVRR